MSTIPNFFTNHLQENLITTNSKHHYYEIKNNLFDLSAENKHSTSTPPGLHNQTTTFTSSLANSKIKERDLYLQDIDRNDFEFPKENNESDSISYAMSSFLNKKREYDDILNQFPEVDFYISFDGLQDASSDNSKAKINIREVIPNIKLDHFAYIGPSFNCEVCFEPLINEFNSCKLCDTTVHKSCLEMLGMNQINENCQCCSSNTLDYGLSEIRKPLCKICCKKGGFLFKTTNYFWIHPICMYTNHDFFSFQDKKIIYNSKELGISQESCYICGLSNGYIKNKSHSICLFRSGMDVFVYSNEILIAQGDIFSISLKAKIDNISKLYLLFEKKQEEIKPNQSTIITIRNSFDQIRTKEIKDFKETKEIKEYSLFSLFKSFDYKTLSSSIKEELSEISNSTEASSSICKSFKLSEYFLDKSLLINGFFQKDKGVSFNQDQLVNDLNKQTDNNRYAISRVKETYDNYKKNNFLFNHVSNQKIQKLRNQQVFEKMRRRLKKSLEAVSLDVLIESKIDICPIYLSSLSQVDKAQLVSSFENNCFVCFSEFNENEPHTACQECKYSFHKSCLFTKRAFIDGQELCDKCNFKLTLTDYFIYKETRIFDVKTMLNVADKMKIYTNESDIQKKSKIDHFCSKFKCVLCMNNIGILTCLENDKELIWIHVTCIFLSRIVIIDDVTKELSVNNIVSRKQKVKDTPLNLIETMKSHNKSNKDTCLFCFSQEGELFILNSSYAHFFCGFTNGVKFKMENNEFMKNCLTGYGYFNIITYNINLLQYIVEINNITLIRKFLLQRRDEVDFEYIFRNKLPSKTTLYHNQTVSLLKISIDTQEEGIVRYNHLDKFDDKFFIKCCWICFTEVESEYQKCHKCNEKAHNKCLSAYGLSLSNCNLCSFCKNNNTNDIPICMMCKMENISVASLVPYKDKFIHRECKKFFTLMNNSSKVEVKSFDQEQEYFVKKDCELCWMTSGYMLKCLVPGCNISAHLFCGKITERQVNLKDNTFYLCNTHFLLKKILPIIDLREVKRIINMEQDTDNNELYKFIFSSKAEIIINIISQLEEESLSFHEKNMLLKAYGVNC